MALRRKFSQAGKYLDSMRCDVLLLVVVTRGLIGFRGRALLTCSDPPSSSVSSLDNCSGYSASVSSFEDTVGSN